MEPVKGVEVEVSVIATADVVELRELAATLAVELAEARQDRAELSACREDDKREWSARHAELVERLAAVVNDRQEADRRAANADAKYVSLIRFTNRFVHAGIVYLQELARRGEGEWSTEDDATARILLSVYGPPR